MISGTILALILGNEVIRKSLGVGCLILAVFKGYEAKKMIDYKYSNKN